MVGEVLVEMCGTVRRTVRRTVCWTVCGIIRGTVRRNSGTGSWRIRRCVRRSTVAVVVYATLHRNSGIVAVRSTVVVEYIDFGIPNTSRRKMCMIM